MNQIYGLTSSLFTFLIFYGTGVGKYDKLRRYKFLIFKVTPNTGSSQEKLAKVQVSVLAAGIHTKSLILSNFVSAQGSLTRKVGCSLGFQIDHVCFISLF